MSQTATKQTATMQTATSQSLDIRAAQPEDAESLAAFAERTFRDAFEGDNAPEDMEAYVREAFSVETIRKELEDDDATFLLAFVNGSPDPVGYAKLYAGPPGDGVSGRDPIELQRIDVEHSAIGQGLGAALLQASLDAAESNGHRTIWLGVWERNARAIAFYERWGFETVGDHTFRLGSDDQRDLVMQRAV